jgi:hypothetical protein
MVGADCQSAHISALEEIHFEFRVAAQNDVGIGDYGVFGKVVLPHFAMEITQHCHKISSVDPMIFQLPITESIENKDDSEMIRVLDVCLPQNSAPEQFSHKQQKGILVVGETGAGKTTLKNGLANYICGVNWSVKFRFKLISEDERNQNNNMIGNQACSQTRFISTYSRGPTLDP